MSNIDTALFLAKRCAMLKNLSPFRPEWGPLGIPCRLLETRRTIDKDSRVEPLVIGSKMNGNVPGKGCPTRYLGWWDLRLRRLRVDLELHLGGPVIIILRHKNHMVFPQVLRGELP